MPFSGAVKEKQHLQQLCCAVPNSSGAQRAGSVKGT